MESCNCGLSPSCWGNSPERKSVPTHLQHPQSHIREEVSMKGILEEVYKLGSFYLITKPTWKENPFFTRNWRLIGKGITNERYCLWMSPNVSMIPKVSLGKNTRWRKASWKSHTTLNEETYALYMNSLTSSIHCLWRPHIMLRHRFYWGNSEWTGPWFTCGRK